MLISSYEGYVKHSENFSFSRLVFNTIQMLTVLIYFVFGASEWKFKENVKTMKMNVFFFAPFMQNLFGSLKNIFSNPHSFFRKTTFFLVKFQCVDEWRYFIESNFSNRMSFKNDYRQKCC